MRYTQAEKMEVIQLVEQSEGAVTRTLEELDVPRSTFYRWYDCYLAEGYDGLADRKPGPQQFWNQIPAEVRLQVVDLALE
jgi:putative transposase